MSSISPRLRQLVCERASGRCEYCQLSTDSQIATFPVDHIVPKAKGGETSPENLALACPMCNAHKWAFEIGIDPRTGARVELFNPRLHNWNDHFEWRLADPLRVFGISEIGRATIAVLQMNDSESILVREYLTRFGIPIHP